MTKKVLTVMALALLAAAVVLGLIRSDVIAGLETTQQGTPDPYKEIIRELNRQLANSSLSQQDRASLTRKLESMAMLATQRAEGLKGMALGASEGEATPIPVHTYYELPDGIDNAPPIPIHSSTVKLVNAWRKNSGQQSFLIYAGCLRNDPSQGIVFVSNPDSIFFDTIESPTQSGCLKIEKEADLVLTLTSEQGEIFLFDVSLDAFVDGQGVPIDQGGKLAPAGTEIPPYPQP